MKSNSTTLALTVLFIVVGAIIFPQNVNAAISSYTFNDEFAEIEEEIERQIELLGGARYTEAPTAGTAFGDTPVQASIRNISNQLDFLRDVANIGATMEYRFYNRARIVELEFVDTNGNLVRDIYDYSSQTREPFRYFGRDRYIIQDYFAEYIRNEYGMDASILLRNPEDVNFGLFSSDVIFQYKADGAGGFNARFSGADGNVYNETLDSADVVTPGRRDWDSFSSNQQRQYAFDTFLDLIVAKYPAETSRDRFTAIHNYINAHPGNQLMESDEWFSSPTYHFEVHLAPSQLITLNSILSPATSTTRTNLALVSVSGSVPESELLARVTFAPETVGGDNLPALTVQYRYGDEIGLSEVDFSGAIHNVAALEEFIDAVQEKITAEYGLSTDVVNDRLQVTVDLFDSQAEADEYLSSLTSDFDSTALFGSYSLVDRMTLTVGDGEGFILKGTSDQDEVYEISVFQQSVGTFTDRYTFLWTYDYDGYNLYRGADDNLTVRDLTDSLERIFQGQDRYYASSRVTERELAEDLVGYLVDNQQSQVKRTDCHLNDVDTITDIADYYATLFGFQRDEGFRSLFNVNYRDSGARDASATCVDDPNGDKFENLRR